MSAILQVRSPWKVGQSMDTFVITCPYCGEAVELHVEEDMRGSFVQDCEVCCHPWLVRLTRSAGDTDVTVVRADGSE